jgi:hypothetical protein
MDTSSSSTVGADHSEYRGTAVIDLSRLVTAYLEDYQWRQFRVVDARGSRYLTRRSPASGALADDDCERRAAPRHVHGEAGAFQQPVLLGKWHVYVLVSP